MRLSVLSNSAAPAHRIPAQPGRFLISDGPAPEPQHSSPTPLHPARRESCATAGQGAIWPPPAPRGRLRSVPAESAPEDEARAVSGAAHGWRADSGPCTRCSPSALAARALSALLFGRTCCESARSYSSNSRSSCTRDACSGGSGGGMSIWGGRESAMQTGRTSLLRPVQTGRASLFPPHTNRTRISLLPYKLDAHLSSRPTHLVMSVERRRPGAPRTLRQRLLDCRHREALRGPARRACQTSALHRDLARRPSPCAVPYRPPSCSLRRPPAPPPPLFPVRLPLL
jgi:hypothetical protein